MSKKGVLFMMNSCEKHGRDDIYAYLNDCINAKCFSTLKVL